MKTLIVVLMLCVLPTLAWDIVPLDVGPGAAEADWRDALAAKWQGQIEVRIPYGRIDVVAGIYVVELDFLYKWAEGLGQAAFYAESTGKQGVVALIVDCPAARIPAPVLDKLRAIEQVYNEHDLHLVLLTKE